MFYAYLVDFYQNYLTESSPRTSGATGDDWRSAFDAAANGPVGRSYNKESSRSKSNGHSRRYSDPPSENGDVNSGANSGSRRTPNRLPPAPPQSGSSGYKYF